MKKEMMILTCFILLLASCAPEERRMIDPANVTIGYIGCSNTRETVEGYHYTGGTKMWGFERRYGSGTILDWAKNIDEGNKYWDVFDDLLEKYPKTKTIWWELCIMDQDRTTSYEQANTILNKIRERIPDAVIYVSPLPPYTERVCEITGTFGLEKAKELAKELDDKNQDVFAGPLLGPMTIKDTAEDGCHLSSPDGKRKLGNQMRLFFDAEEYSADEASIGYVGCSNTMQTVASYDFAGGRRLWAFNEDELHEYDGGAVVDWSKGAEQGNKFWKTFDRYLENNPNTNAIFWQLCIRKEESTLYEEAVPILEAIRQKVPGAIIYVSALPPYTEGVCEITGTAGIERAKSLVEELDLRNDDVIPGPVLGPMTPGDTDEDGCHLSGEGLKTIGQQMREFFDAQQNMNKDGIQNSVENVTARNDVTIPEEVASWPEQKPLTFEEQVWKKRIDKAMAPTLCPPIENQEYPENYYQGPLIDTHLHIPAIPDSILEEGEEEEKENNYDEEENEEGAFGGPQAILGENVKMSEIACTLKREGTHKNFAFFPVYPEIYLQAIEIANKTMAQYPDLFTSFIMPPTEDTPTVEAPVLRKMLTVYPNLFQGYGEVGSSPTEPKDPPPDDPLYLENYKLAREYHLLVYYHLGRGHKENFERVLAAHPNMNFIWHGDALSIEEIEEVLSQHPNAYYGIEGYQEGDYGIFPLFVGKSKRAYLDAMEKKFDGLVDATVRTWKPLIERHPDQVLWGTDRGDAEWNYDVNVGLMMTKYARAFIGRLNPAVQEKFAYKNAERLIVMSGENE